MKTRKKNPKTDILGPKLKKSTYFYQVGTDIKNFIILKINCFI